MFFRFATYLNMVIFFARKVLFCFLVFNISVPSPCFASELPTIKVSALEFGTINWVLQTIKRTQLDKQNGFNLTVHPVASTQAGKIALQANAADIIISDWIWVARLRGNQQTSFSFAPYSSATGGIMVSKRSPITQLSDLAHKKIGIAGGPLDKNWLLLQVLALKQNIHLNDRAHTVFGAPPLLNNLFKQGEMDALVNFWHYNARLKADGYVEFTTTQKIIEQLGIKNHIPMLGYVFRPTWAHNNSLVLNSFLNVSQQASLLLCHSDPHWTAILPLTRTDNVSTQALLREGFCKGRITHFSDDGKHAVARIYSMLADIGGEQLTGPTSWLDPDLFWPLPSP